MNSTITPRYGHDPRSAFAATRAFAERSVREMSSPSQVAPARKSRARLLLRRSNGS